MRFFSLAWLIAVIAVSVYVSPLRADDDGDDAPAHSAAASGRYFFDLLDHGSSYGNDFFPDSILGPEFDAGNQAELDYAHDEKRAVTDDEVDADVQVNPVGMLSLEGEFGWEGERHAAGAGDGGDQAESESGMELIDLAAYHPVFQFVSSDGVFDYTAAARVDVGIPTRTPVSGRDAQLTPYLGHLLRIGQRFSLQAWTGSEFTIAPHPVNHLIYGATAGYDIPHAMFPLPLTSHLTPLLELDGDRPYSGGGQDALLGLAGVEVSFPPAGEFQPRLTVGYELPLDQGARDELEWGVVAEVFLDF